MAPRRRALRCGHGGGRTRHTGPVDVAVVRVPAAGCRQTRLPASDRGRIGRRGRGAPNSDGRGLGGQRDRDAVVCYRRGLRGWCRGRPGAGSTRPPWWRAPSQQVGRRHRSPAAPEPAAPSHRPRRRRPRRRRAPLRAKRATTCRSSPARSGCVEPRRSPERWQRGTAAARRVPWQERSPLRHPAPRRRRSQRRACCAGAPAIPAATETVGGSPGRRPAITINSSHVAADAGWSPDRPGGVSSSQRAVGVSPTR